MRPHCIKILALVFFISGSGLSNAAEPAENHSNAHRHHVALFVGGTHVFAADHTGVTYGVDYEYQLTPRIGVGGLVERAEGAIDATTLIALIDIHVTDRLVLQMGPGIEFEEGEEIAIGRIGAYYEFELGGDITVAPSIGYDISEQHDAIILGVLLGRKF